MSLSQAQNLFMPANINSIVLLLVQSLTLFAYIRNRDFREYFAPRFPFGE